MNKKKLLPLGVLAAVVLLLAAALAVLSSLDADETEEGVALFSTPADSVTAIAYQDDESDVSLTKNDDGSWTLDSDPKLPIDTDAVTEVLNGVTDMKAARSLEGSTLETAETGLDAPTMQFSFTAEGANHTLIVGAENDIAGAYYVQVDGGTLYTVDSSAFVGLCKTPRQLYEAQDITDIETSDVATMTLDTGDEVLSFTRDSDGNWTLDGDPDYALDQDTVSRMSSTICSLTTDWSITSPTADDQYGLDHPNAIVRLTATDGRTVTCTFGSTDPDDEDVAYLRASTDESVVYEIAANHLSCFAYNKESLKAATPETATAETAGTADSSQ